MKFFRNILLVVLLLCPFAMTAGSGFSYIYIQGDKKTPFYVKFEDQMLPRYGKHYSIIPQLAPGTINIQILFQQNMYPPQRFTITVPENGFRGFLLMKKGEAFALYDIHQQFFLQAGNNPDDDRAPVKNSADAYVYTHSNEEVKTVPQRAPATISPKFLENVELKTERVVQNNTEPEVKRPTIIGKEETPRETKQPSRELPMHNSDCPTPVSAKDFDDIYKKIDGKNENVKLKYLLTKMDNCYTSSQVRILAKTLDNDPERYTFLKRVFPRVTDQANFPMLENLLTTKEWKSYFQLIIP